MSKAKIIWPIGRAEEGRLEVKVGHKAAIDKQERIEFRQDYLLLVKTLLRPNTFRHHALFTSHC